MKNNIINLKEIKYTKFINKNRSIYPLILENIIYTYDKYNMNDKIDYVKNILGYDLYTYYDCEILSIEFCDKIYNLLKQDELLILPF